jgi:hypothetical protein
LLISLNRYGKDEWIMEFLDGTKESQMDEILHISATNDLAKLAKHLLDRQVDIERQSRGTGQTALCAAAKTGSIETAKVLLMQGAAARLPTLSKPCF